MTAHDCKLTHVSLFTGIGGFDKASDAAGFETVIQVEIAKVLRNFLKRHYPNAKRFRNIIGDFHAIVTSAKTLGPITVITGGDPCPIRSKARGNSASRHPDLSGYFLALVGLVRPTWVVRENVPAPDDLDFKTGLELLGYESVIISTNGYSFTGQSRPRDFIIGSTRSGWEYRAQGIFTCKSSSKISLTADPKWPRHSCLTTNRGRTGFGESFIHENGRFRTANCNERARLAGFDPEYLQELAPTRITSVTGNAVIPAVVRPFFDLIRKEEINARHTVN